MHLEEEEDRNLLIRFVVPIDDDSRDRIIKFTNSQTPVPVASLRATEKIHRDIETFFFTKNWFYDRRKNFYKNAGKPKDRIIGIPYLAQAIMAVVLREPNNARARPSSLIKDNKDHDRVFNSSCPIELYFESARFMNYVDDFLRRAPPNGLEYGRNNLKFHLAMFATALTIGKSGYDSGDVNPAVFQEIDDDYLSTCLEQLESIFESECYPAHGEVYYTPDSVAKSSSLMRALEAKLSELIKVA